MQLDVVSRRLVHIFGVIATLAHIKAAFSYIPLLLLSRRHANNAKPLKVPKRNTHHSRQSWLFNNHLQCPLIPILSIKLPRPLRNIHRIKLLILRCHHPSNNHQSYMYTLRAIYFCQGLGQVSLRSLGQGQHKEIWLRRFREVRRSYDDGGFCGRVCFGDFGEVGDCPFGSFVEASSRYLYSC